ncbi:MAG: 30S ribosomal protein S6 [Acidobacteriota bacterium]|nr:30S ribosomal protein S6 [Acidobacteriota bacterium]MDQ7088288.1 30S ribosomal protein S6 [Acidobacteriota bacterium]
MRRYEMVLVADPTIPEDAHDRLITGFETMISEGQGVVHKVDRWGRRKLAYPIRKHLEGNYTVLLFDAPPELEREMVRRIKLSDHWLRFFTVRADHQQPPTEEEKQALVEARREHLRRAAERAAQLEAEAAAPAVAAAPEEEAAPVESEAADETVPEAPVETPADPSEAAPTAPAEDTEEEDR